MILSIVFVIQIRLNHQDCPQQGSSHFVTDLCDYDFPPLFSL